MSNSSRLAQNSAALFFRMILRLGIALYTTRVVLDVLGADDYGIYVLVAGFSSMFSFVNTSMSTAMSRFISVSIGKGDDDATLTNIFGAALLIQIALAAVVMIAGAGIGLFFIYNYVDIPFAKVDAAAILYMCTLLGLALQMLQVPYNAVLISYEKMTAYAYFEIVNSVLLLLVAYVLNLRLGESLVVYGILLVLVYISVFCMYVGYCKRFSICKFQPHYDKRVIKPMLTFSGADLFSNSSLSVQAQGQNVIFNKYYTLSANAAIGIANQIYGAMLMFSGSITTAIRPHIIKSYAANNIDQATKAILVGSKLLTMALICISIPLIIRVEYILGLWLGTYPPQSCMYVAIILTMNAVFGYKGITVILLHAVGHISRFSIISGCWYLSAIPVQYLLGKLGVTDAVNYAIILVLAAGQVGINLFFISRDLHSHYGRLLVKYCISPIIGMAICLFISNIIDGLFAHNIIGTIIFGLISVLTNMIVCWFVVLDKSSRKQIANLIEPLFNKLRK